MSRLSSLTRPVNSSSLALFRILFGLTLGIYILFVSLPYDPIFKFGNLNYYASFPLFNSFHLKPLIGNGWFYLYEIMGISALCIGLGFLYSLATFVFFASYLYLFLVEMSFYNNHKEERK
jgi:vitamin K-dependent gamma-carboxylase